MSAEAGVPPRQLAGREAELEQLRALSGDLRAGRGRLVLLSGEAGIGKTTLLEVLAARVAAEGARVLTAHADEVTGGTPYSLWSDLARQLPRDDDLPPFPAILRDPHAGRPPASLAQLRDEVAQTLEAVARRQPLLLIIEDLHWADAASVELLCAALRRLVEAPVLTAISYRADDVHRQHPLARALPQLARLPGTVRLELPRLDAAAVDHYVRAQFALPATDRSRLVTYLMAHTEGNPLYFREALRALVTNGVITPDTRGEGHGHLLGAIDEVLIPPLLQQLVETRLAQLSDAGRRAASIAAVIGQQVPFDLWRGVLGVDPAAAEALLAEAIAARVLEQRGEDELRFSHALVRDALYAALTIPERRRWHRQVADLVLASDQPDPDLVVYHLRKARDDRLTDWLVEAGLRANRNFALRQAAERYEEALRRTPAREQQSERSGWLLYANAILYRYADTRRAAEVMEQAARVAERCGDPVLRAITLGDLGMLRCFNGDIRRGLPEIEAGFRLQQELFNAGTQLSPEAVIWTTYGFGAGKDSASAAYRITPRRGTLVTWLARAGRLTEARDLSERFLREFDDGKWSDEFVSSPSGVFFGLACAYAGLARPEPARRQFTRTREALRALSSHVLIGQYAATQLVDLDLPFFTDDLTSRRELVESAVRAWQQAEGALPPGTSPRSLALGTLLLEGQWSEARRLARAEADTGFPMNRLIALRALVALNVWTGNREAALRRVCELLPEGAATEPGNADIFAVLELQRLMVELELSRGDAEAAREWLEAHERWIDWSGSRAAVPAARLLRATWHRLRGDHARAEALAREARALAEAPRMPLVLLVADRLLGELATARLDWAAAESRLTEALRLAEACRAIYERALTLLARAELHVARSRAEEARSTLNEARAILQPLDARPALERLAGIDFRLSGTAEASEPPAAPKVQALPAGLSPREAEVLRLIAGGRSNREIGEALFLSVRTVERHVGNLYLKIDAHSRADATAYALRHGLA